MSLAEEFIAATGSSWSDDVDFPERPAWHAKAACRGMNPDLFFPVRGEPTWPAKQVCRSCPVRDACTETGLMEKQGIWGGLSERQRREARRGRIAECPECRCLFVPLNPNEKYCNLDCRRSAHAKSQNRHRLLASTLRLDWRDDHGTFDCYQAGCRCVECGPWGRAS